MQFPNHVVAWHLNILRKFAFVKREMYENCELYFDPQLNIDKIKQIHNASKAKRQKILNCLKNNESSYLRVSLLKLYECIIIRLQNILEI